MREEGLEALRGSKEGWFQEAVRMDGSAGSKAGGRVQGRSAGWARQAAAAAGWLAA